MSSNRLLDMLKSATTSIPPTTSSSSQGSFDQQPEPSTSSSGGAETSVQSGGSPREPSPSPPPPSLQAVSLSELFASMTTTKSTSSAPSPQPLKSPQGPLSPRSDQKAKLLGMLNSISPTPAVQKQDGSGGSGAAQSSSDDTEKTRPPMGPSAAAEDILRGSDGIGSQTRPSTIGQPVIHHPSGTDPTDDAPSGSETPVSGHAAPPAVTSPSSKARSLEPVSAGPLKKAMFEFVSPFSAFEPPPKPPPVKQADKVETGPSNGSVSPKPPSAKPEAGKATPALASLAEPPRVRQASGVASSGSSKDLGLPYLLGKVVAKGVEGKGPERLGKDGINIDLSQSNLDSLVNSPEAIQIIPTTIMRSENVSYHKGRDVGLTSTWLAYTMSKGRARLIDYNSAARLVLQLPPRHTNGPVLDLAVTSTLVAMIGVDHSVTVFQVPKNWTKDDPPTQMILHMTQKGADDEADTASIGALFRVEWVERGKSEPLLAVGGPNGVIVFDPMSYRDRDLVTLADVSSEHKRLSTEGRLVGFCLNASHQAIGLLSDSSTFTLYNVSNLNRVWNRKLPSKTNAEAPSSVQFCESNILVGRSNNTSFDLVQITVDLAVLTTISFAAKSPSPPHLHFGQAVYDASHTILWIAPFSRGSLFGFKYNLKGVHPAKANDLPAAFDMFAEYPLEPVLSLVIGPSRSTEDQTEMFFATPNGFNQVQIPKMTTDALTSASEQRAETIPALSVPPPAQPKSTPSQASKRAAKGNTVQTPVKQSPALSAAAVFADTKDTSLSGTEASTDKEKGKGSTQDSGSSDEIAKALKRTENTLQSSFKQLIANQVGPISSRLDSLATGGLADEISAKVEKQLKASVTAAVQQEVKKTVLPALNTMIQSELRSAVTSTIPPALSTALQGMPRDLERTLAPAFQRIVSSVVQTSIDRAVQDALTNSLLPTMDAANARLAEQLQSDFKSEMVQIRKDFSPPLAEPQPSHEPLLRALAASVAELQQQVSALSAQVSRGASQRHGPPEPSNAPLGPAPIIQYQPQNSYQSHPSAPPLAPSAQQPAPQLQQTPAQLEDAFLSALGAQNTGSTIQLVNEYWPRTEQILPTPPGKSPLSQAVLLTLFHRAAVAVSEVSPYDAPFSRLAQWLRRVAQLLEPRNPETASFYPRVLPVVQGIINNTIGMISQRFPGDVENVRLLRSILEVVGGR
ncbi:hypothetical protein BD324DRAFT_619680 [Kockovaella imperatae]|uniref:Enhancer of mRNA-decapping protein 4 WD40 repeat region domain-containing protein n=1 Tax=Kockovaella imperatae TaxID=4999 RepID=A0A1Y1UPC6_9TREE|nr:hypothetical protein BD324DRAFT_619680 [Kockovaella imperatae]ORX39427.1 hypothetical protein BD324DRAFT_619680 [Kockovaella imperatae]